MRSSFRRSTMVVRRLAILICPFSGHRCRSFIPQDPSGVVRSNRAHSVAAEPLRGGPGRRSGCTDVLDGYGWNSAFLASVKTSICAFVATFGLIAAGSVRLEAADTHPAMVGNAGDSFASQLHYP